MTKAFRGELVPQDPTDESAPILTDQIRAARAAEPERPRRGRGPRRDDAAVAEAVSTATTNGHATNGRRDESVDLVVGVFQIDRRLTATAITEATGLDASTVKNALRILVDGGQGASMARHAARRTFGRPKARRTAFSRNGLRST